VIPSVVFHMTMQCGQGCSLLTRTIVHESIHDELVAGVAAALAKVRVGDPSDESVDVGPLISAAQRERVEGYIKSGIDQNGELAFGGGRPAGLDRGYFVEPTLFARCTNDMTIAQDEIFGPVQTVIPFSDIDEAVRIANDSRYGLGGAVWSADTGVAYDVAKRLRAGFITVNGGSGDITPYGPYGGYKQSGLGREFGQFGFDEFIETKSIGWPAGR
jgi:aldehyde dehydrogenase (NAD+)